MREGEFQGWVMEVAQRFGWRVWHVPAPMRASGKGGFVGAKEAAGLPDLFMIHHDPPRMVIAEVKGDGGQLSPAQKEFLALAKAVSDATLIDTVAPAAFERKLGVYVFHPGMEDAIESMLRSKVLS